MPLASWFG